MSRPHDELDVVEDSAGVVSEDEKSQRKKKDVCSSKGVSGFRSSHS